MNLGRYVQFRGVVVLLAIFCLNGCERIAEKLNTEQNRPANTAAAPAPENALLLLGKPSNATADPKNRDNYLLEGQSFVLSYNNSRGTLNWAAWRTTPPGCPTPTSSSAPSSRSSRSSCSRITWPSRAVRTSTSRGTSRSPSRSSRVEQAPR